MMNSKFLLLALVGLIPFALYGQVSFAFPQEDSQLKYDAFDNTSTILADDKLIFFTSTAKNEPPSISVQDTKTGSLIYKIYSPHKSLDDEWFGKHISLVGSNIAASSTFLDPQTNKWTTLVHVFDGKTGMHLYTIDNPVQESMHFGYTMKSIGNRLAVYASDTDPNDDIHDNVVHVFDGKNGSLLYTIANPLEEGDFGRYISTINNNFLVHVGHGNDNLSGTIHAFDADTGKLQYTIEHPSEDIRYIDPYFGGQSIISEDHVIVKSEDVVYVFDGVTGELSKTEDNPITTHDQLDAMLDSIEGITNTADTDDSPFSGVFAFFENLFSWIMPSQEEAVSVKEYVATFDFEGDELGNYEKWCLENNGDWIKDYDCGFANPKDHKQARDSLRVLTDVYVDGKPAKDACEFLELMYCDKISSLPVKFDMRTGQYTFKHFVGYKDFEVRVNGDGIQYRPNVIEGQDESSWIDYESAN